MVNNRVRRIPPTLVGILSALVALPVSALNTTQIARVVASDASALDFFGRSVALDGDTAVIAAPSDDTGASDSGSIYVFARSGTGWTEEAKLTAPTPLVNGYYGGAVAIDGDTLMVGSSNGRVVYVYARGTSGWVLQQSLTPADSPFQFGAAIALNGDIAIVTAPIAVLGNGAYAGAAYVYLRNAAGTWVQQQKLTASDANHLDQFGRSVALHGDTAIFGATDDDDAGNLSGSATSSSARRPVLGVSRQSYLRTMVLPTIGSASQWTWRAIRLLWPRSGHRPRPTSTPGPVQLGPNKQN